MSEQVVGAIGTGDGLPIDAGVEQARALGADHGEVLNEFSPTQQIYDDADALNAYVEGFNLGLRRAASHITSLIAEVQTLKTGTVQASSSTSTAKGATDSDVEREISEAHTYRSANPFLENAKRKKAGLPELSEAEMVKRALRISDYLAARREKDAARMIGF